MHLRRPTKAFASFRRSSQTAFDRIRVMESVPRPRPTTNPYNKMLSAAVSADRRLEHQHFSWRAALFSGYEVFHWHWPEAALSGISRWRIAGKHIAMAALIIKHRLARIAVVRTVHNIELPDTNRVALWLLRTIERGTTLRIVLNEHTDLARGQASVLILHGHYCDWFADLPREERIRGRIGYFGAIRRYKGVSALLDAYQAVASTDESASLRIGGKPSTPEIGDSIRTALAELPRAEGTLAFLSDAELVELATASQVVVLPYRHMHNSGSVLAALSLNRPVLVPRTPTNEALGREVGPKWVLMFDGDLDAEDIRRALNATSQLDPGSAPDLSKRDWAHVGEQHAQAYCHALQLRRR